MQEDIMDIQKHARTRQIKRLSGYLYKVLTGMHYFLQLGWIALAVVVFMPVGTYVVGNSSITVSAENIVFKWVVLLLYGLGLAVMIMLNRGFRQLMKRYMSGHIFTSDAIHSARYTLRCGMAFIAVSWVHVIAGATMAQTSEGSMDLSFLSEVLFTLLFFALMYTLMWALEIGHDLNEESEKTI